MAGGDVFVIVVRSRHMGAWQLAIALNVFFSMRGIYSVYIVLLVFLIRHITKVHCLSSIKTLFITQMFIFMFWGKKVLKTKVVCSTINFKCFHKTQSFWRNPEKVKQIRENFCFLFCCFFLTFFWFYKTSRTRTKGKNFKVSESLNE